MCNFIYSDSPFHIKTGVRMGVSVFQVHSLRFSTLYKIGLDVHFGYKSKDNETRDITLHSLQSDYFSFYFFKYSAVSKIFKSKFRSDLIYRPFLCMFWALYPSLSFFLFSGEFSTWFANIFRYLLGLFGRVISPSQGLDLHRTTQHRKTLTYIHASNGIRTHDSIVGEARTYALARAVFHVPILLRWAAI
jgi:hypothetical protein